MNEEQVIEAVKRELARVDATFAPYHSAHEGWAVMYEEVCELWDEVRVTQSNRSLERMRKEAIQVAVTAIRFATNVGVEP